MSYISKHTSIPLNSLNTSICTALFIFAVHLARRKENLCTFLLYIVSDIAQEVREHTSFPVVGQTVAIITKWNLIIAQSERINFIYPPMFETVFWWVMGIIWCLQDTGCQPFSFFFFILPLSQKSKLSHLLLGEHDIPLTCLEQVVTGKSGGNICNITLVAFLALFLESILLMCYFGTGIYLLTSTRLYLITRAQMTSKLTVNETINFVVILNK